MDKRTVNLKGPYYFGNSGNPSTQFKYSNFRKKSRTILGFHVTQVGLIITQVKNKIAYHSINWVKKLKYRRRVINKQRTKVSGMCHIPNSSYSAKGITENYSV